MKSGRLLIVLFIAVVCAVILMPAEANAATSDPGGKVHVVKRGETLSSIASKYGLSPDQVATANQIPDWNVIYVGQRLWIPGKGNSKPQSASGQTQDTLSSSGVHVVSRGETLTSIARRYGVSKTSIRKENGIRNANQIYVGQHLNIPGKKAKAVAASASTATTSPKVATGKKWIEIDLSKQRLIAHQGDSVILKTKVSTGLRYTPTPIGKYRVRYHVRRQTMSGPGYRLPNVQWVMYFIGSYAIHGTYWHNNFGRPMSHGCVNVRNNEAKLLYNWAENGTLVVVHR